MSTKKQKLRSLTKGKSSVICAILSRGEAAKLLGKGTAHVHSTGLGDRDPLVVKTRAAIDEQKIPVYSWELDKKSNEFLVLSSKERQGVSAQIVEACGLKDKRHIRERVELIVEELLTNAIYHAYLKQDGSEKYNRQGTVVLATKETVKVHCASAEGGTFLSIEDNGGHLDLAKVGSSLMRCYGNSIAQIEAKESGAGLGIYLVFELATHIKIVCAPGRSTKVSVWISDKNHFDPGVFSFNFFRKEEK
jgi:hypothetical protein